MSESLARFTRSFISVKIIITNQGIDNYALVAMQLYNGFFINNTLQYHVLNFRLKNCIYIAGFHPNFNLYDYKLYVY